MPNDVYSFLPFLSSYTVTNILDAISEMNIYFTRPFFSFALAWDCHGKHTNQNVETDIIAESFHGSLIIIYFSLRPCLGISISPFLIKHQR